MQPRQQSELLFNAANEPKNYEALDTGHLPHLDDPATLGKLLSEWLSAQRR